MSRNLNLFAGSEPADQRFAAVLFGIVIAIALSFLLEENFLFSQSFDILSLREIDDFAFQTTLRTMHQSLSLGHPLVFISDNDYGYGAFFWMLNALAALPGYLLGWDRAVIVAPRLVSFVAAFGALVVLWKIAALYTKNPALRMAFPLLMAMQPEFAFAAMRFHTHAPSFFFSVLSFYFALTIRDERQLWWPLVALACAIGIKINAIILGPIIAGALWLRWGEISSRPLTPAIIGKAALIAFALSVYIYNPLLLFFPFFPAQALHALHTLATYAAMSGTNPGDPGNEAWKNMLLSGLFYNYSGWWTLPLIAGAAGAGFLGQPNNSKLLHGGDILKVASGGAGLAIVALLFKVKQGPFAYANYLMAISFVQVFALLLVEIFPERLQTLVLLSILGAIGWTNRMPIEEFYLRYQHAYNSSAVRNSLADREQLIPLLKPMDSHLRILTDYRATLPISNFTKGVEREDFFDNLAQAKGDYDYVVLHRDSPDFFSEEKIKESFVEPENYLASRLVSNALINGGSFNGRSYEKIFDNERLIVFKQKNTS